MELLLRQCKQGNYKAQKEIYKRYYSAMYNTSYRVLYNSSLAEDVMQESFLVAFTKLDTFSGESTFGAWLKRIVINKSISELRKNKSYIKLKQEYEYDSIEEQEIYDEAELGEVEKEILLKHLSTMNENYKVYLTLHFIEGYDYEEIMEIMDVSYQNCRTSISRAKKRLRETIYNTIK
ncbi:MAG: RNA polymerase sigma factor [Flavobacteriaceae bacterium]|nr:RNA polymerase sigma factor [Flavobacteriaceae bacterium]